MCLVFLWLCVDDKANDLIENRLIATVVVAGWLASDSCWYSWLICKLRKTYFEPNVAFFLKKKKQQKKTKTKNKDLTLPLLCFVKVSLASVIVVMLSQTDS